MPQNRNDKLRYRDEEDDYGDGDGYNHNVYRGSKRGKGVPDYYITADDNQVVNDALQAAVDNDMTFDDEESQFLLENIPEDTDPATRKALEKQLLSKQGRRDPSMLVRQETNRVERARRYSSSESDAILQQPTTTNRRRQRKYSEGDSSSDDDDLRRRRRLPPKPEDVKPEKRRSTSPPGRNISSPTGRNRNSRSPSNEVIYRDRDGRKISRQQWLDLREEEKNKRRKKPETTKISEADLEWGGGLKQKQDERQRLEYERSIAKAPFARHDIDETLDAELKARHLWEDPMASSGSKRRRSSSPLKTSKKFPAPPNRFGILPGSRWDGRIRGNGFEQRFLAAYSAHKSSKGYHNAMD